jgi:hypothetical protein
MQWKDFMNWGSHMAKDQWLHRQLEIADREVRKWPEWRRSELRAWEISREVSRTRDTTPTANNTSPPPQSRVTEE